MRLRTLLLSLLACYCSAMAVVVTNYDPSLLSSNLFTDITRDCRGYLWVATEYGLNKFDGNSFTAYYGDYGREGDLYTSRVVQLYADQHPIDNQPPLWVLFYGAIQYYLPQRDQFVSVESSSVSSPAFTYMTRIRYLGDDGQIDSTCNALWAHSRGLGLVRIEPTRTGYTMIPLRELSKRLGVTNLPITSFGQDSTGKLYFSSQSNPSSIRYIDKDSICWLAIVRQSLQSISPTSLGATYLPLSDEWSNGEPVYSVVSNEQGYIFIGQEHNGLQRVDDQGNPIGNPILPGHTITSVLSLSNGDVLLGTAGKGIYLLPSRNKSLNSRAKLIRIPLPYGKIKSMVEAEDGNVYVAIMEGGVRLLNMHTLTLHALEGYSPTNIYVNKIVLDSDGILWIAHYAGLDRYHTHAHTMVNRPFYDETSSQVAQNMKTTAVYDILISDSAVYCASNKGLFVLRSKENTYEYWQQFTMEDGLPSNAICRLLPDNKGHLWMSTFRGVSYWDMNAANAYTTPVFINYSNSNGLQSVSYLRSMGTILPSGKMVFPSDNGITILSPSQLMGKNFERPIVLSALLLAGKHVTPMSLSGGKRVLHGAVDEAEQIHVSYLDNHITMQFSTLDMRDPDGVCYEYRFLGSKHDAWRTTLPGINSLTFDHLSYGRHVLMVRAREGSAYSNPRQWIINIRPPFYLSGWAIMLYVMLLIFIVWSIIYRYHMHQEQELLREQLQFYINRTKDEQPVLLTVKLKGNDQVLMENMMGCISTHIADSELSVDSVAEAVGISRAQLQRRVKEITGKSVGSFVRELRLKQAAKLLLQGDVDVAQVAYTVGFSAPNVFSTAFKRMYGVSPSEYIKNNL